jgi:formylglycine-generating enzyme required for sulfatase activity
MNRLSFKPLSIGLAALACLLAAPAGADQITYQMVTVGDPGNANDTGGSGIGRVDYSYQIGTYSVTIGQYTAFLNAVAKTDTYSLYNPSMATNLNVAGILQTGPSGAYVYGAIAASGTAPYGGVSAGGRPITYVSWFDAARFANWMANGQGSGSTENGAYDLANAAAFTAPAKNLINPNTGAAPTFYIPTENEWYKAAYYSPLLNSDSGGYYAYATQRDEARGNLIGGLPNQANWRAGDVYTVTYSGDYYENQNYLTDVGAFSGSGSFYGTFDQSGNVYQWNDLDGLSSSGSTRGLRGGSWNDDDPVNLSSSFSILAYDSSYEGSLIGFRLASPVSAPSPVPEIDPNSIGSVLALVLGSLGLLERRRLKAA